MLGAANLTEKHGFKNVLNGNQFWFWQFPKAPSRGLAYAPGKGGQQEGKVLESKSVLSAHNMKAVKRTFWMPLSHLAWKLPSVGARWVCVKQTVKTWMDLSPIILSVVWVPWGQGQPQEPGWECRKPLPQQTTAETS